MENVFINALATAFNEAVQKQVELQLAALTERIAALEAAKDNPFDLSDSQVELIVEKVKIELDIESEVDNALSNIDFNEHIDTDSIVEEVRGALDIESLVNDAIDGLSVTLGVN